MFSVLNLDTAHCEEEAPSYHAAPGGPLVADAAALFFDWLAFDLKPKSLLVWASSRASRHLGIDMGRAKSATSQKAKMTASSGKERDPQALSSEVQVSHRDSRAEQASVEMGILLFGRLSRNKRWLICDMIVEGTSEHRM